MPLQRREIIQSWLDSLDVRVQDNKIEIARPDSDGTVIIPAYNEAEQIAGALESATTGCKANMDVLVVDNNSVDATPDIVKEYARRCTTGNVQMVECREGQGYGITRRKAFGVTLRAYLLGDPQALNQHHVIMLDSDSRLTPRYGEEHCRLIGQDFWNAIGTTNEYPKAADEKIFELAGVPNYLYSISQFVSDVTKRGFALVQTASQGGTIEVGSLAQISLESFLRYDRDDTDRFIGWEVRRRGGKVGLNPAVTVHHPRRIFTELALGLKANESYSTVSPEDMRVFQSSLTPEKIDEILSATPKQKYAELHLQRLQSFIRRNIVVPIQQGLLSCEALELYLKEQGDKIDLNGEKVVEQLADFFIKRDPFLSEIHQ